MTSTYRSTLAFLLACALVFAAGSARAGDDVVSLDVSGEADAGHADAETRALDDAFARAVTIAVAGLTTADQRNRFRRDIGREIMRHARRYVASYSIKERARKQGAVRLEVTVRVKSQQLAAALAKIGVAEDEGDETGTANRPKVLLLVRATLGQAGAVVNFGGEGDGGPVGRAVVRDLAERGFTVVNAAAKTTPVQREATDSVPMDDAAATELAAGAGAGAVVLVGVSAQGDGPIRGTRLTGASARGVVRVLDTTGGRVVAEQEKSAVGFGSDDGAAIAMAATAAAVEVVEAVGEKMVRFWPPPMISGDNLTVAIQGARTERSIRSIESLLSNQRIGDGVVRREYRKGQVRLAVKTRLSAPRVAAALRSLSLEAGQLDARPNGDSLVEVNVTDSASSAVD